MYDDETTIGDHIIAILTSARSTSIYRRVLWERVQRRRRISKEVFSQTLYRMNRRGYIHRKNETIRLAKNIERKITFPKPTGTKQILVLFDIPEYKKKARDWLRYWLRFWNFEMVQKSAWKGTGPLPDIFMKHLKTLSISEYVKIFTLTRRSSES